MQRVFDGHNDVLLRPLAADDFAGRRFLDGDGEGHLDLPRARAGGLAGGFFAVYVPGERAPGAASEDDGGVVDFPHIGPVDASDARRITLEMSGILLRMAREQPRRPPRLHGAPRRSRPPRPRARSPRSSTSRGPRRSAPTSASSRCSTPPACARSARSGRGRTPSASAFPSASPATPTKARASRRPARSCSRACNRLGILVRPRRTSTPPASATWRRSPTAPLVATHSNAHAVAPASRNLTDVQLDVIAESRGVVGLNYRRGLPARRRPPGRRHRADGADPPPRPPDRPPRRGRRRRSAPTSTAR